MDDNTYLVWIAGFSLAGTIVTSVVNMILTIRNSSRVVGVETAVKAVKEDVATVGNNIKDVKVDVHAVEVATNSHAKQLNEAIEMAAHGRGFKEGQEDAQRAFKEGTDQAAMVVQDAAIAAAKVLETEKKKPPEAT